MSFQVFYRKEIQIKLGKDAKEKENLAQRPKTKNVENGQSNRLESCSNQFHDLKVHIFEKWRTQQWLKG